MRTTDADPAEARRRPARRTRRGQGKLACGAATTLMLSVAGQACFAQSALPGTAIVLEPVTVEGARLTVAEEVRLRLEALPGGAAVLSREDLPDSANLTVSRAFQEVPGVVVQEFFGGNDQPRIQIRGSGLQQNPVERGILVLRDGLPLNRADGSYIVGFADPRQAEAIEVYRGYMANRLGATVLGGALNFVSPTGTSAPGGRFAVGGGSFGHFGLSGQAGYAQDGHDGSLQFDFSRQDGYREYNASERATIGGNFGFALSDTVRTRIFLGYTQLGFDVAGPLNRTALDDDPTQVSRGPVVSATGAVTNAGPNVMRDRPRRDAQQFLIGSRTTGIFGAHRLDGAVGYTYTDDVFRFPVSSGVRSTEGGDLTTLLRYAYQPGSGPLPLFEATAQYTVGSASRRYYLNRLGTTGALFGANDLDAQTLSLHAGLNIPLPASLTLSPSISYSYATRDSSDTYGAATRPTIAFNPRNPGQLLPNGAVPATDTSYARSYEGWTPALALSFRPDETQTAFVAVSRSFEPPTHDDLLATVNGTPNSSPGRPNPASPSLAAAAFSTPALAAQTATTVEAGWRGRRERLSWDAVAYYSWVKDELLSLRDFTGAPLGAVNADETRHFGVELGLGARITDRLSGRIAYTYQDFRFHDDPVRGNNRIAGAPRHVLSASLRFQATEALQVMGAVRWIPERTPADNLNTQWASPYAIADLRAEYRIVEGVSVYGEVTNLFDKTYAASTLIVDQAVSGQALYLPGQGRAFYAGIVSRF